MSQKALKVAQQFDYHLLAIQWTHHFKELLDLQISNTLSYLGFGFFSHDILLSQIIGC